MKHLTILTGVIMLIAAVSNGTAGELPALDGKPKPGIYALTNTCNWVQKDGKRINLFETPVDGVTNYVTWRMVRPAEESVRYPGLDRMMREAVDSGKFLSYGILAGIHTPDWVYEKAGIPRVVYDTVQNRGGYLPWLETGGRRVLNTPFLEVWEQTVKEFSERLHADPNRDRINYVPVTGFPFGNGLELYIPLGKKDFDALKYDRLSQKLYIEFCCRVIDIFLRHFPDMPLGIAYTDWFGADAEGNRRDLTESTAILGYAVAQAKKNGAVVVPMGLWLGWDGICTNPDHPMLRLFAKSARTAGFGAWEGQMGSCERKCLPLAEQIELARRNRVEWVQFWHHDCICAECVKTLGAYRKAVAR